MELNGFTKATQPKSAEMIDLFRQKKVQKKLLRQNTSFFNFYSNKVRGK